MDMSVISLIGIILGVVVFIVCAFKSINLILGALLASLIMILTSGMPILETITGTWATGFSGYMKSYFLIFCFGSVFGKMLGDGGGAKRISIALYRLFSKSKRNPKFWGVAFVPAMYAILTYAGVSGLVVVYSVLDIAQGLFQRLDIPWRMYCNGGSASSGTYYLGGSMQLANIAPMAICGTSTTAGMGLSIIASGIYFISQAIIIKWDLKRAEKNGEGFMDTGAAFVEGKPPVIPVEEEDMSELPSLGAAVIPMIVMIGSAGIFKINILYALLLGIILCAILFHKHYKSYKATLGAGVLGCYAPMMTVSATSAIASLIRAVPGSTILTGALGNLPPLLEGAVTIWLISFVTASSPSAIENYGPDVFATFQSIGLSPEISHRIMSISSYTGIPPHSSGIVNATQVAKIQYSKGIAVYMRNIFIGSTLAWIVSLILVAVGVFR